MSKNKQIELIPLSSIVPDESQPRKNFDARRLGDLQKSIGAHGIINPIVVEQHGSKYLLVDGERRYRAAKEIGLKELPAIVQEPRDGMDRLIQQFHLQEQHEGWSNTEKASAMIELADKLNLTLGATAELLALPKRTVSRYLAFGRLLSRVEFQKNEIPLEYANAFLRIRKHVKKEYGNILNEEFDSGQERELEHALIHRVKSGEISTPADLTKLTDSISASPRSVEKFMKNEKVSLQKLFLDSQAKVNFYARNLTSECYRVASFINLGEPIGLKALVQENEDAMKAIKAAREALNRII